MRVAAVLLFTGSIFSLPAVALTGAEVYAQQCAKCHDTGLLNSAKLGDKAAWAPRLATGVNAMTANVIKGKNAMPPRGTCPNCTDAELRAAVEFMAKKVR